MTQILKKSQIEALCRAGSSTPSGANAQPWKVNVEKNKFTISIDKKKETSFLDVERYASFFSIGSFVENVVTAAEELGLKHQIAIKTSKLPQNNHVEIIFKKSNSSTKNQLYKYIEKRCTNRNISDGRKISEKIIESLKKSVNKNNNTFSLHTKSDNNEKKSIAKALGVADGIRTANDTMFKELIEEVRWTNKEIECSNDGIDVRTLELPKNYERMLLLLKNNPKIRKLIPKKAFEESTMQLLVHSSHLCCLATNASVSYKQIFEAGRVIQNLWLKTTEQNIAFHPWTIAPFLAIRVEMFNGKGLSDTECIKIEETSKNLKTGFSLKKHQTPVFIFRLSYAKEPTIKERKRNWKEFTKINL